MNFKTLSKKLISAFVILAMMLPLGISAAFAAEVTSVTVELSSPSVTLGESVDVIVNINGADAETSTVIKVNGGTIDTIIGDYYKFTYTPTVSGVSVISATSGSKSGSVDLEVYNNAAPEVTFDTYSDGETIRTQLLDEEVLTAYAMDSDDIEKMEVLVDGNVFATAEDDTISVIFAEIGLGTFDIEVVAYDSYGLVGSAGITAKVLNEQAAAPQTVGEGGGISLRNGLTQADKRFAGYGEFRTLEDGNVVLAMGADERCSTEQTNNDYSLADIGVSTYINQGGVFALEFDAYYQNVCTKAQDTVTFAMREQLVSGANIQNLFSFRTSAALEPVFQLKKKNSTSINDYVMELQKWYHIRVMFDWQNDKADIFITPPNGSEVQLADDVETDLEGNGGKPNVLRLMGAIHNNKAENYADVYFDNFQLTTVHTPPTIREIKEYVAPVYDEDGNEIPDDSEPAEEVPYTATKIRSVVDVIPVKSSVTTDTVYLIDSLGNKIKPKSVTVVNEHYAIDVELSKALDPGATYTLVLDKTMKMTSELQFGADVKKSFKVAKAGCFAEEDDTKWYYAGNDAICVTNLVNGNEEAETVYVLRSVWYVNDQGQNVAKTVVDEVVLESGDNSLRYTLEGAKNGEADMYVITDLTDPTIYAAISK